MSSGPRAIMPGVEGHKASRRENSETHGRQGMDNQSYRSKKGGRDEVIEKQDWAGIESVCAQHVFHGPDSYFKSMKAKFGTRFPRTTRIVFGFPCEHRRFAKNCKDRGFFLASERI
jgi:hypothetical protein